MAGKWSQTGLAREGFKIIKKRSEREKEKRRKDEKMKRRIDE